MKKFKVLLLTLLLAGFSSFAADDSWLTDFEKAKELSAKSGKPILADFSGSDWCIWCKRLDKEVFSQEDFKKYAKENLVLFLADFPSRKKLPEEVAKQNAKLAEKYQIRGYPTVLILDKTGKELVRTGYQRGGSESYIKYLKETLANFKK